MKETIKRLVEAYGPSGYEEQVRELIREEIKDLADEIRVDALGNLIARKGQAGQDGLKVMLSAHMDEIGVMVAYIDEKGFARFTSIGGVSPNTLIGNRVRFANGTVGAIHIDEGLGGWRNKSLETTPHSVHFVFSVQEEIGLVGARTSAYGIDPDLGIAVDVTGTGDTPEATPMAVALGDGPAIKIMDGGMLAHPAVKDLMIERAEAAQIPYQLEILRGGTTDALVIQVARAGVPAGCLSIPTRHLHTPSEMVDLNDVQNAVRLLVEILSQPIDLGLEV
jgi:endoglucanase